MRERAASGGPFRAELSFARPAMETLRLFPMRFLRNGSMKGECSFHLRRRKNNLENGSANCALSTLRDALLHGRGK